MIDKNDVILIKDALVIVYEGADKKFRPYVAIAKSANFVICYSITTKNKSSEKSGKVYFRASCLNHKSYLILHKPVIIARNISHKKIGTLTTNELQFILHKIENNAKALNALREQNRIVVLKEREFPSKKDLI